MGFLLFGGSVSVVLLALVLLLLLVSLLTSFAGPSLFLELASFSEEESVVVVVVAVFLLPGAGVFSIDEDAFFSTDDFLLPGVVLFNG